MTISMHIVAGWFIIQNLLDPVIKERPCFGPQLLKCAGVYHVAERILEHARFEIQLVKAFSAYCRWLAVGEIPRKRARSLYFRT